MVRKTSFFTSTSQVIG